MPSVPEGAGQQDQDLLRVIIRVVPTTPILHHCQYHSMPTQTAVLDGATTQFLTVPAYPAGFLYGCCRNKLKKGGVEGHEGLTGRGDTLLKEQWGAMARPHWGGGWIRRLGTREGHALCQVATEQAAGTAQR